MHERTREAIQLCMMERALVNFVLLQISEPVSKNLSRHFVSIHIMISCLFSLLSQWVLAGLSEVQSCLLTISVCDGSFQFLYLLVVQAFTKVVNFYDFIRQQGFLLRFRQPVVHECAVLFTPCNCESRFGNPVSRFEISWFECIMECIMWILASAFQYRSSYWSRS